MDSGKIALSPAVELSYLSSEEQEALLDIIESEDCTPSLSQACRMKKESEEGILIPDSIFRIMTEVKGNQKEKVIFKAEHLRRFFPNSYTTQDIEKAILQIVEADFRHRQKERNDGAR